MTHVHNICDFTARNFTLNQIGGCVFTVAQAVFDLSKVLNGNVREGHTEAQSACPPMLREHSQGPAICDDHQHLGSEDGLNGTGNVETQTNDFWIPSL